MNEKEALRLSEVYSLDNPLIQVEHLTHIITSHVQNTVILNDITFSVPRGSLFAITGPSGSGKSTILNMLTGVDRPTSGRILFAGEELRGKSENTLARWRGQHVGIIFQFFQLIPKEVPIFIGATILTMPAFRLIPQDDRVGELLAKSVHCHKGMLTGIGLIFGE